MTLSIPRGSQFSSVQFSRSVVTDTFRPHGLQQARLPRPSPIPGVYLNSCPSHQWCHNCLTLCHPLLLPPSVFPRITVFSNESVLPIIWPKYRNFSFSISSNEYSGLISFRIDWFDLAGHGTLGSLPQHQSSKVSILWHWAFFLVQLTHVHDYWKNHSFWLCKVFDIESIFGNRKKKHECTNIH